MCEYKKWSVATLILSPLFVSLLVGEEFWPITSFPMYSQPYQRFAWPSVMVRSGSDRAWHPMTDEDCYGRLGYVRFHFSALKFSNEARAAGHAGPLFDLTNSLAHEIRNACPNRDWTSLKVVLNRHDVRAQPIPTSEFIRDITDEVPIAP